MINGAPFAFVVSVDGMDEEQIRLCGSPEFWTLTQKRGREKTISRAELQRRLGETP